MLFVGALAQGVVYSRLGLGLLLASFAAATAATLRSSRPVRHDSSLVIAALQVLVLGALFLGSTIDPGLYLRPGSSRLPFTLGTVALAVAALDYSVRRLLPDAWRFPVALAGFGVSALWMLHVSPAPKIDVWSMQTEAARFLLAGANPYSQLYENIYGHTHFLSESLIVDGRIRSFPYPPLVLLLGTAGYALADVRLGTVLAIALAAWAMRAIGRRRGLPPGHAYELLPLCLLSLPNNLLMVEQGWTDTYPAAAGVILVASLGLSNRTARALGLALFVASKQYVVIWIPVLWARRHLETRVVLWGGVAAFTTALPFLLWDGRGVFDGLVRFQLEQVFRPDSLSLAAPLFWELGWKLPRWLPLVSAALLSLWLGRRRKDSLALTTVGGALIFLGLFLTSPQAFLNYYWFCGALLLLGTALELCRQRDASLGVGTGLARKPSVC
jgi:hypothetical protein